MNAQTEAAFFAVVQELAAAEIARGIADKRDALVAHEVRLLAQLQASYYAEHPEERPAPVAAGVEPPTSEEIGFVSRNPGTRMPARVVHRPLRGRRPSCAACGGPLAPREWHDCYCWDCLPF